MLKTLSEATKYIIDTVKEVDPEEDLDEDAVSDILEDLLLERLEDEVSAKDVKEIMDHVDDEEYITSYIENRVPHYYTILNDIVKETLTDYITRAE